MLIRSCTSADFDEVNRLMRQTHLIHAAGAPEFFVEEGGTFSDESFADGIADENQLFLCAAQENGVLCGFCHVTLQTTSGEVALKNAHIANIIVDEACRGQGIGHALIAESEARAKAWGAVQINLLCWQFNDGARRLYESLGMRPQRTFMIKDL